MPKATLIKRGSSSSSSLSSSSHWSRHPAVLESVLSHDEAQLVMVAYHHNQFQLQQHWMQMMKAQ
jgi:hypothetical protein